MLNLSKLSVALWRRGGKRKKSFQLRLWNLNSTSNSPVDPNRLSCQIYANQREAQTIANVNKHWKTLAKGYDVKQLPSPPIRISHQLFQRRYSLIPETCISCTLSFLFPPRRALSRSAEKMGRLHPGHPVSRAFPFFARFWRQRERLCMTPSTIFVEHALHVATR